MMDNFIKFFKRISPLQWEQLDAYKTLLLEWNKKVNLISRKDTDHIFDKHILPILPAVELNLLGKSKTVLDIGTGGGIPGIILGILFPDIAFTLLDSIHKKMAAVTDICHSLRLSNITVRCERLENLKEHYDVCVGRGVVIFDMFVKEAGLRLNKRIFNRKNPYEKQQSRILYWSGGEIENLMSSALQARTVSIDLEAFFWHQYCKTKKILCWA